MTNCKKGRLNYVLGKRGVLKLASLEQKNAVVLNPDQLRTLRPLKLHDSSWQLIRFLSTDCFLGVIYLLLIGINRRNRFFRHEILSFCITSHLQKCFICILMTLKSCGKDLYWTTANQHRLINYVLLFDSQIRRWINLAKKHLMSTTSTESFIKYLS